MPRGGCRPGAGRKCGSCGERRRGLEHLLSAMRDESRSSNERLDAAAAAVEALLLPALRNNHTKSNAADCWPLDTEEAAV
jgi:hypothetical protein